jgi:N-acetylmuramoyl-L-alanine amidase
MRLLALLLVCVSTLAHAADVRVENLRMWPSPERTRLVFDVSGPVEHRVFTLQGPERVVVDLSEAVLARPLSQPDAEDRAVARVRSAMRESGDLRIVLDLKRAVRPKSFLLKPNDTYGHRLVLDLYGGPGRKPVDVAARTGPSGLRDVVIAIDAGHGGEDPGAIGPRGTREKEVVLAIARRLERLLEAEQGMRPVMVRTGDYYLRLRKRILNNEERQKDQKRRDKMLENS